MPAATRLNDNCTGHDACPPAPLVEGSPCLQPGALPVGSEITIPRTGVSYTQATRT